MFLSPHTVQAVWGFFIFVLQLESFMILIEEIYSLYRDFPHISTDSRAIIPGSLFIALKGDHFDGNRFAADALQKGAAYAVIDNPAFKDGDRYIVVPDTLGMLKKLALHHRNRINAKIIGVTGTNGKTTTKELIAKVLATSFNTIFTKGNLNNHIGVPLTVLSIKEDTEFAVIEMGANHQGEIADLCRIAKPAYGIITNIGKAHLEGFGGYEGVIRAKSELYSYIRQNNGLVFLNLDNQLLVNLSGGMTSITYGTRDDADCTGQMITMDPYLTIKWNKSRENGTIKSSLYGHYNFENILAAVCIGSYFGISPEKINSSIGSYSPDNNRSQWINTGKNNLVLDAYNANPSSMKAALLNFHRIDAPDKMIILGDMMELGHESQKEHLDILYLVKELSVKNIVVIGENFSTAAKDTDIISFHSISDAENWFRNNPVNSLTILLKGSRKMQLEKLVTLF
jgi:UDP-N-acetylmuramoyl-tripeptide--D-alanyl-D-alanine ligase